MLPHLIELVIPVLRAEEGLLFEVWVVLRNKVMLGRLLAEFLCQVTHLSVGFLVGPLGFGPEPPCFESVVGFVRLSGLRLPVLNDLVPLNTQMAIQRSFVESLEPGRARNGICLETDVIGVEEMGLGG